MTVLMGLNLRPFLTSIGPVLDFVRVDTGIGFRAAGALTTLPFILMGTLAFFGMALVMYLGERRAVAGALVLLTLVCASRAWAGSATSLIVSLVVCLDHLPGSQAAGALAAFMQGIGFLIVASGPLLIGWLRDNGGSFTTGWDVHLALTVMLMALTAVFSPDSYKRSMAGVVKGSG
ncbi:hypothetical protein PWP93_25030 [Paraburkholderia sp. A1RI-2L]|uniref:hypothetical protein n=1 Tax=Paraburkholderia sp. A1RI-2L TaxID=3028367 RepID=UPI003B77C8A5